MNRFKVLKSKKNVEESQFMGEKEETKGRGRGTAAKRVFTGDRNQKAAAPGY